VLVRPTASPISRIDGGWPRFSTDSRMTWSTLRCRQVSTWSGSGLSGVSGMTTGPLLLGFRPERPFGGAPRAPVPGPGPEPLSWASPSSTKDNDSPRAPAYRATVESAASCWPDSSLAITDCEVCIRSATRACERPDATRRRLSRATSSRCRAAASGWLSESRSASALEEEPESALTSSRPSPCYLRCSTLDGLPDTSRDTVEPGFCRCMPLLEHVLDLLVAIY
jgi:hypothetical protein